MGLGSVWWTTWLVSQPAPAWEVDPLTGHHLPLKDATESANDKVDALLDEAADRASARLAADAPPQRVARVLVREVYRATARRAPVPGRGTFRGLGYGVYSAWLEQADLPRLDVSDREDLFDGIPAGAAPILSVAGTCSTVSLAGIRVGTDKPDHFFDVGFDYWRRAERRGEQAALAYGTRTERTYYGWLTSSAFSWADLAANLDGLRFYQQLLDPEQGYFAVEDGVVRRVRDFDWADWVQPDWDELENPPTYRPAVQEWLDARLDDIAPELCEAWPQLEPHVRMLEARVGRGNAGYTEGEVKVQGDPFGLRRRCEDR